MKDKEREMFETKVSELKKVRKLWYWTIGCIAWVALVTIGIISLYEITRPVEMSIDASCSGINVEPIKRWSVEFVGSQKMNEETIKGLETSLKDSKCEIKLYGKFPAFMLSEFN